LDASQIPNDNKFMADALESQKPFEFRKLVELAYQRLRELEARYVVLSAIESRSAIAVGKMTRSIQTLLPDAVIVVGLWSLPITGAARFIRKSGNPGSAGFTPILSTRLRVSPCWLLRRAKSRLRNQHPTEHRTLRSRRRDSEFLCRQVPIFLARY
jgi:hypothetical protein